MRREIEQALDRSNRRRDPRVDRLEDVFAATRRFVGRLAASEVLVGVIGEDTEARSEAE